MNLKFSSWAPKYLAEHKNMQKSVRVVEKTRL